MARKVSNPLALAVLALLLERPRHPYDMGRTMRERGQEESIKLNFGSLYSVLEQLLRAGFVAKRETLRETARPERTIYEITGAGRDELHNWMAELVSTPVKEFRAFEAALALLGVLLPDEAVRLLGLRRQRLEARIAEQRARIDALVAGGLHPFFLIENEYRLALENAEKAFVDQLLHTLGDEQVIAMWRGFHEQSAKEREKGEEG
ncbi:MAG TPA: PadR family transcriptional regulator [Myxococcaceae bacterium]|nr:PadR family transcriptional regulator [Myxococcaceae bacterium]